MMAYTPRQMTEEKRAKIAELWNLGWTSSHIADAVGLTRNSVIGAVHRLRKRGDILVTGEEKKQKTARPKKILAIRKNIKVEVPENTPVGLLSLTSKSCRFIVTEEGQKTKYCNHQIWKQSYCKDHYKICYYSVRSNSAKVSTDKQHTKS